MRIRMMSCPSLAGAVLLVAGMLLPATASAEGLTPGQAQNGRATDEAAAVYTYEASDAGILTIAVRGAGDTDLRLIVTDADGQMLPEGKKDADVGGAKGAEQMAVTLTGAGTYQVRVEVYSGGSTSFELGSAWLPFPQVKRDPDPDGAPSRATVATVDNKVTDQVQREEGDRWDWYKFSGAEAGTLTVVTKAPEGDLKLEYYEEGKYVEAAETSDKDIQEVKGNEALSLQVTAGKTIYFRVLAYSTGAIPYTLSLSLLAD